MNKFIFFFFLRELNGKIFGLDCSISREGGKNLGDSFSSP